MERSPRGSGSTPCFFGRGELWRARFWMGAGCFSCALRDQALTSLATGRARAFLLLSLVAVEGTRSKRRHRRAPAPSPSPRYAPRGHRGEESRRSPLLSMAARPVPFSHGALSRCRVPLPGCAGPQVLPSAATGEGWKRQGPNRVGREGLRISGGLSRPGRWGNCCLRICDPPSAVGAGPRRRTRRPSRRGARTGRVRGRRCR